MFSARRARFASEGSMSSETCFFAAMAAARAASMSMSARSPRTRRRPPDQPPPGRGALYSSTHRCVARPITSESPRTTPSRSTCLSDFPASTTFIAASTRRFVSPSAFLAMQLPFTSFGKASEKVMVSSPFCSVVCPLLLAWK
jgi:hypothetical protein